MRLWLDASRAIITDEQLVGYVATFGSLSEALKRGDVRLISDTGDEKPPARTRKPGEYRRLADYLEDET